MTDYLFNRIAVLAASKIDPDTGKPTNEFTTFRDLDIEFSLEKNSENNPNKGQITIYNLNPTSRALFQEVPLRILLLVGYGGVVTSTKAEGFLKVLFNGDITSRNRITTNRQGKDIVTTIELGDSELALSQAKVNVSLNAGATLLNAFTTVLGSIGLPFNTQNIPNTTFEQGVVLDGEAKDVLTKLTDKAGLEWSVQDGEIQILPQKAASVPTGQAVVLNQGTGLIGSPTLRGKDLGVEFVSLINPDIKPTGWVVFDTTTVQGFYRVRRCTYVGNTQGGPWFVRGEAIEPGAFI